jgi:hypothetical protein
MTRVKTTTPDRCVLTSTELGRLFLKFERASYHAWQQDGQLEHRDQPPSRKMLDRIRADFDAAKEARHEFLTALATHLGKEYTP